MKATQWPQIVLLCSLFFLSACQTAPPGAVEGSDGVTPLDHLPALSGDYFEFQSDAVGRPFHIYVRLPEGYSTDGEPYPVVYLLDGDSLFPILAASHLFLTYDVELPEAIVVGIAYGSFDASINKRGYDFTAPAPDATPEQGGAPAFHRFLASELIPEVESRYHGDASRRVLFGQSRGGYMVLYSAFTDPDLFWGRIASNATFDPGRALLLSPAEAASRQDLGLVVTSGSHDFPGLREAALEWHDVWKDAEGLPWALNLVTIEGGTHAASSVDSYKSGMLWLFR